ncbi:MAG: Lar family restriction alleviation protein [Eubacteriales bacterium]|nr:Lar family restriction alleviation protein [Eubacteriales bacterium]
MDKRLKPCPFCEGDARLALWGQYRVYCIECRANSGDYLTDKEAIIAWNQRAYENQS